MLKSLSVTSWRMRITNYKVRLLKKAIVAYNIREAPEKFSSL